MKFAVLLLTATSAYGADALFRQTIAASLAARIFPAEYVLYDVRAATSVVAQWTDAVPVGSLLKPFLAVAHKGPFPILECDRAQCWRSHGRVGIDEAIAYSCNSYFLQFLQGTPSDELNPALQAMGLPAFPADATASSYIGLGGEYRVTPLALLRAFGTLASVRVGLELAVQSGTLKAARVQALGKTGTAPCTHARREQGDGFALLWTPEWAVLVRQHNTNGSTAAITAGEILRFVRGR